MKQHISINDRVKSANINVSKSLIKENPTIQSSLLEGANFMFLGDYGQAISHFDSVLIFDQNHIKGLELRGICYLGLNEFEKSISDLDRCLKLNPNNCFALLTRSLLFDLDKDINNTEKCIIAASQCSPIVMNEATEAILNEILTDNHDAAITRIYMIIYVLPCMEVIQGSI